MKQCPFCAEEVQDAAIICRYCRSELPLAALSSPGSTDSQDHDGTAVSTLYYPVSVGKFVILSVLTFGLYELYWFYKNWVSIRERDQSNIWPWARAMFSPLLYEALIRDLAPEGENTQRAVSVGAPIAYFLVNSLWRLPDPYWLLAFLTFLPLLPAVKFINALNASNPQALARNSTWRPRHALLALVAVPLVFISVAPSTGLVPATRVVSGSTLSVVGQAFLNDSGVIEPGENVLYFYAGGMFSFAEDGNILTDRRVISYWTDAGTSEFFIESATFSQIAETSSVKGDWLTPTSLAVVRQDGTGFVVILSVEEQGDEMFIRRLEEVTPHVSR